MSDKADAIKSQTELPRRSIRLPAEIGPLFGLVGVFVLFLILLAWRGQVHSFLSLYNLQLLMHQNAIHAVVVIGALFVIISGGIDLSVGSVAALAAVSTALAYKGALAKTGSVELASVAAIVLTLRRRPGGKPQNIALQVAARAKDRVRIVKMASEKRP